MKFLSYRYPAGAALALLLGWMLAGCQSGPPKFACSVPTSNNVESAFAHAKSDLSHEECQYEFDNYVDSLLHVAASDPSQKNEERFSNLFSYARDVGILSQTQARHEYQRYFTTKFVSLGDQYNNCSSTCKEKQALAKKLKNELGDKNQGLLQAAGERTEYAEADKQYNELLTLMDATCAACRQTESKPQQQ